jgi:hypothetical protein
MVFRPWCVAPLLLLNAACAAQTPASSASAPPLPPALARRLDGGTVVEQLRAEAAMVMHTVECDATRRLLINTSWLPVVESRTVHRDAKTGAVVSHATWEALSKTDRADPSPTDRSAYAPLELDEEFYYYTRYGSPLAYARPLDLIAKSLGCKDGSFARKRILDFGYGGIGHLRLLASCGANVVGVDVDPVLPALYSREGDTGEIPGAGLAEPKPPAGSLTLVLGRWPASEQIVNAVGKGYDLIISKNTLKNGYIHPEKDVPASQRIDLGVDDATFLKAVASTLNEGGLFLIYNICPKQSEEKFIPWADGRCPFSKEAITAAGLETLDRDVDDTVAVRALGKALNWDEGENAMDLEKDCFATYTLIRKPPK